MSARKFLALALAACQAKQYEEAGVFLGQAAKESDAETVAKELGADLIEDPKSSVSSDCEGEGSDADTEELDNNDAEASDEEETFDWGDDEEDDEEGVSTSSTRRRSTTESRIGRIMAAAMSVSSDDQEDDGDEDTSMEADPDFPGETLVPASFSSVKVKSSTDKSGE